MNSAAIWSGMAAVALASGTLAMAGSGSCGGPSAIPASYTGGYGDKAAGDIVDVAVGAGQFSTLAKLLGEAGLVETLKSEGPFTVFAPTDAAFAKLPKETVDSLLRPENRATLVSVLTYHVVPGKVTSDQVVKMTSAKTVQGSPVTIKVQDGQVMINNAKVTKVDVGASNGVIHVIDTVIMPPAGKN